MFNKASDAEVQGSLKTIMRMMYDIYGKKEILLIDEYDVPLANATEKDTKKNNYYSSMLDVIKGIMSTALKDNEFLEFAVITGCLRIAKDIPAIGPIAFVEEGDLIEIDVRKFGGGKTVGTGIMVCGLNGSGKSTLGKALAEKIGYYFIDNETLFFPKTDTNYMFASPRSKKEVEKLLMDEVREHENFVFAAVKGNYGEEILPLYKYIVLIDVPKDIRMQRVRERSFQKFGSRMMPGGDLYEQEEVFMNMVSARTKQYVEEWVDSIEAFVIRVDGTKPVKENVKNIAEQITERQTKIIPAYDHPREIGRLFSEYTDMLIAGDSSFREYLNIQNYEEEVRHLEVKYGLPCGRLYLAYYEGKPAGCVGLRKIDKQNCEMKRLYVRPQFRGKYIGDHMIQKIIEDAKDIGYSHMLLDTLPFLESAIHLYRKHGFYETENYNDSPMSTSIFMRLDLQVLK